MYDLSKDYLLQGGDQAALTQSLDRGGWRCLEEPVRPARVRLLDSFDWGIYLAGALLEERQEAGALWLRWQGLADTGADAGDALEQALSGPPGLAQDLPPGPLRGQVLAAVGVRRLLPVVELQIETRVLRLLDEEDKTLVRLSIECAHLPGPQRDLPPRLRVLPLKGYEAQARALAHWLGTELALEPAPRPLLTEALDAAERAPGGYSSKLAYRLDPAQRADAAAREILLGLLDTLEANIPGAQANLDSEFLHDLRVATRRTRAALTQIPGVLPAAVTDDFKARFAWLQQVTGPVRDLDVYLLEFDAYQASLPASMGADLEPLRAYVLSHYDEAQAQLTADLGSATLADLVRDWRQALSTPAAVGLEPASGPGRHPHPGPLPVGEGDMERAARDLVPNAARPVKALADERIWRMVRRVRKEGLAIGPGSPAEEMHELRKSCKKLRYLMEFFQSLYPGDDIGGAIKLLKVLLDNLGNFQDLAVQADHLRELAGRMSAEGAAGIPALLAMGALVADLLRRREAARTTFAETFRGFDSDAGRALFRGLFQAPAAPLPEATP